MKNLLNITNITKITNLFNINYYNLQKQFISLHYHSITISILAIEDYFRRDITLHFFFFHKTHINNNYI